MFSRKDLMVTIMNKISLQMYTMRDYTQTLPDLDKTLERLRDIGFEMVQYSIPKTVDAKEVKKLFDKNAMVNDSVFCSALDLEECTSEMITQCELFGTDYIRTDSIPRGLTSSASGYKMFAHYLNEVSAELKCHGKKILYHFHSFEFIRFKDTTGIEILLAETDPEVIQIIPDTHWIQSGGMSPQAFLEKYKDRYDYIHTKDFALGDITATWEGRPINFAPVGEGNLNWVEIIRTCKNNNVLSYAIEQDECYGRDPFDCVKSSFDYLTKIGVND